MIINEKLIGVMQGRLLPKYMGRYQAHPIGYWGDEFEIAASLNLSYIEFILDFKDASQNPLLYPGGRDEILKKVNGTGVKVSSICADYFMEAPLHHPSEIISDSSLGILKQLIENGDELGIADIVIPCVDQSSLVDIYAQNRLVKNLLSVIDKAEQHDINLALETDLAPEPFALLLDRLPSSKITVNYDTGNSASCGYNLVEEFACYGSRISDIHIKDRKLSGGSVVLGTGDADFKSFLNALNTIDYNGIFIMQAYRDDEGLEIFKDQLRWFKEYLKINII